MTALLELSKVTKRVGSAIAVHDIDLTVAIGECVAVVGPNGSGCSTLLRLMATVIAPSAGSITINGIDAVTHVHSVRRSLAYASETLLEAPAMLTSEYLDFVRKARPGQPARAGRETPGTGDILRRGALPADRRVDSLSAGHRERLSLLAAIASGADCLILDGPLSRADDTTYPQLLQWLRELRDGGTTLVLAPGRDIELRLMCDRVIQLDQGRIVSDRSTGRRAESRPTLAGAGQGH